jgi:hypothetical protein
MKNYTRRNWAIIALSVIALFTIMAFADAQEWKGNYPTALVATGSNLEHPSVVAAAYHYDLILVTPYSYQFIKDIPELAEKAVLFISYFSKSSYDGNNYGMFPNPKDAGNEEMRIIWDQQAGWWSYGYAMTDEWVELFVSSVVEWIEDYEPLGIMLDDHTLAHRWWNIEESDYQKMHPVDLKYKMQYIDAVLEGALTDCRPEAFLMVNGPRLTDNTPVVRFWEGCGRSYNQWSEVMEFIEPGDWLQVNDGKKSNWFLAGFVSYTMMNTQGAAHPVALGFADGVPLYEVIDGEEVFSLPLPEAYYRWKAK